MTATQQGPETTSDGERAGSTSDTWTLVAVVVAVLSLLGAIVAAGFAVRASERAESVDASADGSPSGETAARLGSPQEVAVELGDLYVKPDSLEVSAGTELIVSVVNKGALPHDLKLDGKTGTEVLQPGTSAKASLGTISEASQAWCTVPGHKEAGMVLRIKVSDAAEASEQASGGDGGAGAAGARIDFNAEPKADFTPYDPVLKPAPGGLEHKVTMRATEKVIDVAPGVRQQLWTFNDRVPAPAVRGKVGDIFTFTLVNEGKLGHSIDFHASKVAWNDEMRTIRPGESLTYQFEAKHAGVFMYHCGTAPTLHHIGNGMYGAIVIDPPGLAAVDHEFLLVQSELYTGRQGRPGDLGKMRRAAWDAVVFNGFASQYQHRPIRVEPGQRVRAFVLDAGPSENSSFHVVGTVFDTVYKEGEYQLRPGGGRGGAQSLDLQPAQGGFVEFTFDEPGIYPILTHKFSNVTMGALGAFQAGDVPLNGGG